MYSTLCLTFRGPGVGFVVLRLQLEQGTGQLLEGPIRQPKALEHGVARHADDARVTGRPRAEQTLPQGSDQSAVQMPKSLAGPVLHRHCHRDCINPPVCWLVLMRYVAALMFERLVSAA